MMLVPRRNNFDLFDDFFEDDFFRSKETQLMKSDIKESNDKYVIEMDLPGYAKNNISVTLKNGYLEISAKVEKNNDDTGNEKYIRKERYYGECSRKFYVGEDVKEEDISAEFKNGILSIDVPKKNKVDTEHEIKQIEIK